MKNIIGFRTIKTGLGATGAILIAELLGLSYVTSAGVITILSIQNTKRESFMIALRRLIATIVALILGGTLFTLLGSNAGAFGVYIIVFIPVAVRLKVTEGIVPASVLVTHFLGQEKITTSLFLNEVLLMLVGAGVALLLNLYMPSIERDLLEDKRKIEESMYDILIHMATALKEHKLRIDEWDKFEILERSLKSGRRRAYQNSNNYLVINEMTHYEKYFEMRARQFGIMKYMFKHFDKFYMTVEQTYQVAELTTQVADSIKGKVTVEELFISLEVLRNSFKESKLPVTREEFENRAMLYQFLNDIEFFIETKKIFKESLTPKEQKEYNKYYDIY